MKKLIMYSNPSASLPLVSVIIPSYNHQDFIQNTIQSVINQTYQNIELLIVDDGSSDLTVLNILEMKEKCEKRFVKFYFEKAKHLGVVATLNKLLSAASGEFVFFLDSDDVAKPKAVEKTLEFLRKHKNYAFAVGDNEFIDLNGKQCFLTKKQITYDKKQAAFKTFGDCLSKRVGFKLTSSNFGRYDKCRIENHIPNGYLIRKSVFELIGNYTEEAPLEDWWLMLQISKYAKMKFIDEVLLSYRIHNSNTTKDAKKMRRYAKQVVEYEENLLKNIDEKQVLPAVKDVKNNGVCIKTIGVPFILAVEYRIKNGKRFYVLKILGYDLKIEKNKKD